MGLSSRILIGLLAGIATGLFFGDIVADLKVVGDVFVKLLQMTVLPYIVVSLIAGFGRDLASGAPTGHSWKRRPGLDLVDRAGTDLQCPSRLSRTRPGIVLQ